MTTWTPEDLARLAESYSLVLTAGDSGVHLRAHRGVRSRWYRAVRDRGRGRGGRGYPRSVVHDRPRTARRA